MATYPEGPTFKDPTDEKLRGIDWTAFINSFDSPPTISQSTWSADSGITVEDNSHAAGRTSCKITGGTAGVNYWVENRVVFSNGAKESRGFDVYVRDKINVSKK